MLFRSQRKLVLLQSLKHTWGGGGRGGRNGGLGSILKDPTPWKISHKLINNNETKASKI